ncbi:uncharacterized protein BDV14DRAFT_109901 [Aspergillus stella-maris]|uniref:uncharacterized protein n=1 Tax=Aspergillus stella-maris TaxID=1810926 RepID=UPI003CCCAB24
MSADLFAEFGNGAPTSQPSKAARQQPAPSQAGSLIAGLDAFEDTLSQTSSSHLNAPTSLQTHNKTQDYMFDDFGEFELPQNDQDEVLFDATLETFSGDEDDDWGGFESANFPDHQFGQMRTQKPLQTPKAVTPPATKSIQSSQPLIGHSGTVDLLESFNSLIVDDKPTTTQKPSTHTFLNDIPATSHANVQPPRQPLPVEEDSFEDWGDFTDGPVETSKPKATEPQRAPSNNGQAQAPKATSQARGMQQALKPTAQSRPKDHVRPTNIPPPSILLELFPQLFERLRQEGTEAKRNSQERDALDSVALSIICTLKAVARVVAGRTLRWKRDAILSQSMRIGPAHAGKAGGMKLNTVNKNEDIKEKQEAVDVLNLWRDRAAVFNSVIQAAGRRPVQVIAENTRVTTATASQGAIKASHACALCGLKRDERVPKLDENVEDSFGEWWTEHWGHTECRSFWEDNSGLLGQR